MTDTSPGPDPGPDPDPVPTPDDPDLDDPDLDDPDLDDPDLDDPDLGGRGHRPPGPTTDAVGYDTIGLPGPDPADDFDTAIEVEAAFRTQRRVAAWHALVFLLVVLGAPVLNIALDWWTRARLLGGMSPGFALVAVGLYVGFFVLALAAASLANGVEDAMLGTAGRDPTGDEADQP